MSTIVEATLPAEQFALHETLAEVPDASFEMVRKVAAAEGDVIPFVWAAGTDLETMQSALGADPTTSTVEALAGFGEEYLFRVRWSRSVRLAFAALVEEDATVLDAVARGDEWQFRLIFPERDAVSETYETCEACGLDLGLERIGSFDGTGRPGQFGLTDKQTASMLDAFDAGYYEVPRELKQEELAERLELSRQALSERLRRGHKTLVANALNPDGRRSALPSEPLGDVADDAPSLAVPSGRDD